MKSRDCVVTLRLLFLGGTFWGGSFWLAPALSPAFAMERVDPSGTWTWVRELEGRQAQSVLKLFYRDGRLTGTYKREGQVVPISRAKLDGNEISFEADGKWNELKVHGKFQGKVVDNAINGTVEIAIEEGSLPLPWCAKRGIDFDDVIGNWKLAIAAGDGNKLEPSLKLSTEEGSLKGAYHSDRLGQLDAKEIKLDGANLSWKVCTERDGRPVTLTYKGKLAVDGIKGTVAFDVAGNTRSVEFSGRRSIEKKRDTGTADGAGKHPETPKVGAKPTDGKSTRVVPTTSKVIVMLKSRRETLVVYSTQSGPSFSILSAGGRKVATGLSMNDLQAGYPEIYSTYRTSFANLSADMKRREPVMARPVER